MSDDYFLRNRSTIAIITGGPESVVMTGALVDYDQHVAGAYPE
jgi:hypothetical protein